MKNKVLKISVFVLLFYCCNTTKIVSFQTVGMQGQKFHCQMTIPKGYQLKTMDFENSRSKVFLYEDSSLLFFSNDINQSAFYPEAYKKYGKDLNLKFLSSDTITINGVDGEGKFWEERKYSFVVCGYMKVTSNKKRMFDSILDNVTIK